MDHRAPPAPVVLQPDAAGHRASLEDDKFLETADELARRFGGGTLFIFRHDPPQGFWWDQGIVDRDTLALFEQLIVSEEEVGDED
jgi:hypothetical protein